MEKRIARLIDGLAAFDIVLSEQVLRQQLTFLDELVRWSARINLTAISDPVEGIEKHLLDSLVLLSHCSAEELLDVGSGAGLPAIPLAIAQPELQVVTVESVGKKVSFQKHIRRLLGLENLTPINSRVEALPQARKYPLITARAFAPVAVIIDLVFPLMEEGGSLLLLRGRKDETGLLQTDEALLRYDLQITKKHSYQLPFSGAQRQLLQISRN